MTASGGRASRRGLRGGRAPRSTLRRRGASRPVGRAIWPYATSRTSACAKAILALALERRAPLPAHEPFRSSEWRAGRRPFVRSRERSAPEHLPDHCGVLQERLLLIGEPVQPGGDDALERLRERVAPRSSRARAELGELLGVERVSARSLEERLLRLRGEHRSLEQLREEPRRLLVRERGERDRRRVQLAAAPAGPAFEQLRPSGRDDEQRDVPHPVDELVDEVEQALVRPLQVLEDHDERALLGERLQEAPPGGERLGLAVAAELALPAEPASAPEVRLDPAGVARARERVLDRAMELRATSLGVSCSRMPACALTISPSAQSVTPSP